MGDFDKQLRKDSNLDRLEFKVSNETERDALAMHSNLDRLEFKAGKQLRKYKRIPNSNLDRLEFKDKWSGKSSKGCN